MSRVAAAISYDRREGLDSKIPAPVWRQLQHEMIATFTNSARMRRALVHAGLMLASRGLLSCANQFFDLALAGLRQKDQEKAERVLRGYIDKTQGCATAVLPKLHPPPDHGVGRKR